MNLTLENQLYVRYSTQNNHQNIVIQPNPGSSNSLATHKNYKTKQILNSSQTHVQ